jgi:aspartyl-tRNA synthetase
MQGRIIKRNNLYYCAAKGKLRPIKIDTTDKINNGDLVEIKNETASGSKEIKRSNILVLKKIPSRAKFIDIEDTTPLFKRLENRILDLRRPVNHARFMARSEINKTLSRLFGDNGYINVNTPLIVGPITEGRVKTFNIDFFGKAAFLAMTKLVHLRHLICADFEKVYDLSPVFVGGKHKTSAHVSEYYTFDWANSEKTEFSGQLRHINKILFDLVSNLSKLENSSGLIVSSKKKLLLEEIKSTNIVTYRELMRQYIIENPGDKKTLEQHHLPDRVIEFAHRLYGRYLWVTEFPEKFKQFYCDTIEVNDENVVLASDLWWNKVKVASVSFSNSDYKKTLKRIGMLGLNRKNFKNYLNSIQLGSPEAYLGSLYIERLMMVILGINNIKDALMFPRAAQGTVLDP